MDFNEYLNMELNNAIVGEIEDELKLPECDEKYVTTYYDGDGTPIYMYCTGCGRRYEFVSKDEYDYDIDNNVWVRRVERTQAPTDSGD